MAVTHVTTVRNSFCSTVSTATDAGAGAGYLEFQTAADVEVATCPMSDPAWAAPAGGTMNANAITTDAAATGGTVAKARIKDSTATEVLACSVTGPGGGGDIELNSVVVSAGQAVSMTSLSYTASP